jgi:hypothetical protein
MMNADNEGCLVWNDHQFMSFTLDGLHRMLCLKCNHNEIIRMDVGTQRAKGRYANIIEYLREMRRKRKVTQERLSFLVGFAVGAIERYQAPVTPDQLYMMAEQLNVNITIKDYENENTMHRSTLDSSLPETANA